MKIARSLTLPWPPEKVRDLVCNVEDYPQFLPGCRNARVLSTRQLDAGRQEWDAELEVVFRGLTYCMSTRNLQSDDSLQMSMLSGPFHRLEGSWSFVPAGAGCVDGCLVSLQLQAEPSGLLLKTLMPLLAGRAADRIMEAFAARAAHCFGSDEDEEGAS